MPALDPNFFEQQAEARTLTKFQTFLAAYGALCKVQGFHLDGCGCCGSPYVVRTCKEYPLEPHLEHLSKESIDEVKNHTP